MKSIHFCLAAALIVLGGVVLFKVYVGNHTQDRDFMENPNPGPEGETESERNKNKDEETEGEIEGTDFMLDGDYTYVDNEALLSVIEGAWTSTDGKYQLEIGKDNELFIYLGGEKVLEDTLAYTYLQPGWVASTDFTIETSEIAFEDAVTGSIVSFYHKADEGRGTIYLVYENAEGSEGTLEFR